MMNLQVGEMNNLSDLRNFCDYLYKKSFADAKKVSDNRIKIFIKDIEKIIRKQNIFEQAKVVACFDDSIYYERKSDIISCQIEGNLITLKYNFEPYNKKKNHPNFISLAMRYVESLNLYEYVKNNEKSKFCFFINQNNFLKRIFVEFKFSTSNMILDTFELELKSGVNEYSIDLNQMNKIPLKNISEICFVIHPDDVLKKEGEFEIREVCIK